MAATVSKESPYIPHPGFAIGSAPRVRPQQSLFRLLLFANFAPWRVKILPESGRLSRERGIVASQPESGWLQTRATPDRLMDTGAGRIRRQPGTDLVHDLVCEKRLLQNLEIVLLAG